MDLPLNYTVQGNNLDELKKLPDGCVDVCVTSPPYYGLRDYGTAKWEGGDPDCKHKKRYVKPGTDNNRSSTINGSTDTQTAADVTFSDTCKKCGATRIDSQVGIEKTPEAYVKRLVEIFEEVKRVLKPHGTLWLNLGDTMWGSASSDGHTANKGAKRNEDYDGVRHIDTLSSYNDIKPKDLVGIPHMVAFALRAAGWYWRSTNIWYKRNPVPESVTDRPSNCHEYIFLFSKRRKYYYDAVAVRTPPTEATIKRMNQQLEAQAGSARAVGKTNGPMKAVGPGRTVRAGVDDRGGNQGSKVGIPALSLKDRGGARPHHGYLLSKDASKEDQQKDGANRKNVWVMNESAGMWKWLFEKLPEDTAWDIYEQWLIEAFQLDDVLDITTKSFKEAHFATFPQDLPEICIKAGSSEVGCCAECGKPYQRITERQSNNHDEDARTKYSGRSTGERIAQVRQAARKAGSEYSADIKTVGWQKTCKCETKEIKPAVVLDPFHGAGTTGIVARKLGRNYLAQELNPEYIKISDKRKRSELGLFI